ncbi:MAG: TIGR02147 family protein [Pseudobdellovibrio sp.]
MNTRNKQAHQQSSHRKEDASGIEASSDVSSSQSKPNIFHYHDYIKFLNAWVSHRRKQKKGFSVRNLAVTAGISVGYLPMVLAGQRPLSSEMLNRLMPHLHLTKSEQHFLRSMHMLGTTSQQDVRIESIRQMKRYAAFRENNPNEDEVSKYLTKWHYPAIREMAADKNFRADPAWIQDRLQFKVSLAEVKEALDFLIDKKYIEVKKDGTIIPPEKHIDCDGGIYKIALTQYHQQFLDLAAKSIAEVPSAQRQLTGHTFTVPAGKFEEIRALMSDLVNKIQEISSLADKNKDQVLHLEMALIPLSQKKENSNE